MNLRDQFQQLFTKTTQAHHNADLVCDIGGRLLRENPATSRRLSQEMTDAMHATAESSGIEGLAESLAAVPGGAVNFQIAHSEDLFIYGLATNNLLMHHSIFDGLLGELIDCIAEENPSLFYGAIKDKPVTFQDSINVDVKQLRAPLIKKYVTEIKRESVDRKVTAITCAVKASLPDLKKGYKYDKDFMKSIDKRRHDIVHDISKRVEIEDLREVADFMRNSSLSFIFYVFNKLHETTTLSD